MMCKKAKISRQVRKCKSLGIGRGNVFGSRQEKNGFEKQKSHVEESLFYQERRKKKWRESTYNKNPFIKKESCGINIY